MAEILSIGYNGPVEHMAMPGVRWGVIGSGGIARRRTIPEGIMAAANAELVSVFDVDTAANREVADRFGARAEASLGDLLASAIDAVYVATPVHLHVRHVLACARAGKHVLCEKPLGLTVEEAELMVTAAARSGILLGAGYMMRFHAQHAAARCLVRDGTLGKPVYARAQLSCWYPPIAGAWRQDPTEGGGGALIDMGAHCIDLMEMFFGPIAALTCYLNNAVHSYAPEDSAVVNLRFQNGALGTVGAFFSVPDRASESVLELYGSKGSIVATGTIGQDSGGRMSLRVEDGAARAGYDAQQQRTPGGAAAMVPEPVSPYCREIEDFSQALLDGREPVLSAEIGMRNQRVLAACHESARTGRSVPVRTT